MSSSSVPRPSRVAAIVGMIATLLGGSVGIAAPVVAAGPDAGPVRMPVGEITPLTLTHGVARAGEQPVFAQPFHTLDAGELRAAKLHAAAVASRGNHGPLEAPHTPLAGIFDNTNGAGLNQLTVAPPDSTGSIGPNHYVEMVNQQVGVYDRSLNLLGSSDLGAFEGAPAGLTVTDPQVQWDGQGGHWLYASLGFAQGANMLLFGWSKTPDPSDLVNGWCRFGIARGQWLDDYPKLGHDDHYMSVGTNVYDDTGGVYTFKTANLFAIRKPQLGDGSCAVDTVAYVADAANPLHNADGSLAFTPVPANTADASPNGYIVAAHSPVDGAGPSAPKIMVWHWAQVGGLPALFSDGDVAVSTFDIPAPVPQAGTTNVLDTLDARLTQAVAVNDPGAGGAKGIWTQHTIAGAGGRSIVRWYEILGASPATLRQQGDVSSPTDFVWNGAISPSIGGDSAAVFYNRGGGSVLPVIGARSRTSATPLDAMDPGELVVATSSATDLDFTCQYSKPTDPCRWGDYAGASPDPAHPGVVWGSSQITGPCYILCGFFAQWQTQNFAVIASPSSAPVPPGAPTLNVPTAGNGSVGLSWSAPVSNGGATITDYAILRSTAAGAETQIATTGSGSTLTYTDTAVSNGTTYFYQVAAINSAGSGTPSNERSATPTAPAAPDFVISVTPTTRSVARGAATTFTVTVSAANGFTGLVNLSSAMSPGGTGITRSFNPTGVNLSGATSGQSTFTFSTSRKTQRRSYTVTITGSGGGKTHSTTVTVTVT
jgi:hypothetical protein